MNRFFDSLQAMHQFSLNPSLSCPHCGLQDQFVSHGFVYHKHHQTPTDCAGKRLVCSNRFGRFGCGRTTRLYLVQTIPSLHTSASVLFTFINLLLHGLSVVSAYQKATGQYESRHAWRWLLRLTNQLPRWRARFLTRPVSLPDTFAFSDRSPRLRTLLSTFSALLTLETVDSCAELQYRWQASFC